MNKTIKSCIEDLNALVVSLKTIGNDTERGSGINFAIELAKESINTRIQILSDFIDEADTSNGICVEFIQSAIEVLDSSCSRQADDEYGLAFKSTMKTCMQKLAEIRNKYS